MVKLKPAVIRRFHAVLVEFSNAQFIAMNQRPPRLIRSRLS
jgi:hypothetical protein